VLSDIVKRGSIRALLMVVVFCLGFHPRSWNQQNARKP
jgi:hypothetical protein